MFKQLTNVRPAKSEVPELSTTPTDGNIKINSHAASKLGVGIGDYLAVLKDEDENSEFCGLWLTKGTKSDANGNQFGSKVSSSNNKDGGSLQFGSANAFEQLGGNKETKRVYTVGDAQTHPDLTGAIYKLTFSHDEAKIARKEKA